MTRRISARLACTPVTVATFTQAGSYGGAWSGNPTVVLAQATPTRKLDGTADTSQVQILELDLRVPPEPARDVAEIFTPKSLVTLDGRDSWVLEATPARNRGGAMAYLHVQTGRVPPPGAGWPVDVTVKRSGGRDRRGNPRPETPHDLPGCVIAPGPSSEPVDWSNQPVTAATLFAPPAADVTSTDRIEVPTTPLSGTWAVDGDPEWFADHTKIPLRRR